jgi:hypothetical protein
MTKISWYNKNKNYEEGQAEVYKEDE